MGLQRATLFCIYYHMLYRLTFQLYNISRINFQGSRRTTRKQFFVNFYDNWY